MRRLLIVIIVVVIAASGTAAAENDPFRVAIVDMAMPGMDGEDLGRIIKADLLAITRDTTKDGHGNRWLTFRSGSARL